LGKNAHFQGMGRNEKGERSKHFQILVQYLIAID
jgi:hypothetical protein